eukprot:SAG11_NODE_15558_length_574_cov_0.650526_1_plen_130_part_10
MNQSPAGAAKIAGYDDAFFALRLCGTDGCTSRVLQTHPQGAAAAEMEPIDAMTYSGSHPISRLQLSDGSFERVAPNLNATLFSFSSLVAANMSASARPAAAFSLVLSNRGSASANASFMLNMPLQIENDQ